MRKIAAFVTLAWLAGCQSSEDDPSAESTRFALDPFVAAPGSQGLKCQTFVNATGQPLEVARWGAQITRGGHHVLVFLVPEGKATPLQDCAANDGAYPILFQSQDWGEQSLAYPEGVSALVPAGAGLLVQVHYLNSTNADIEVENAIELTLADSGSVRAHVGTVRFENFDLHLPPHQQTTSSRSCTVSDDVELVWLTSHMHEHGVEFHASVNEQLVYDSHGSGDPLVALFDPVRSIAAGSTLELACSYDNDGDREITFGPSLEEDEMCVLVGAYTSKAGGEPPVLDCELPAGSCLACAEAFGPAQAGIEPCSDDGVPSSAELYAAVQACTCETGCADACAASACAGAPPDDACFACIQETCSAEMSACMAG